MVVFVGDRANVLVAVGGSIGGGDTVLVGDAKRLLGVRTGCVALDVFVQAEPTMVRAQNNQIRMVFLLPTTPPLVFVFHFYPFFRTSLHLMREKIFVFFGSSLFLQIFNKNLSCPSHRLRPVSNGNLTSANPACRASMS